jgi:hypothetical protein
MEHPDRELIESMQREIKDIKSAFVKDNSGETDYAEHRIFHKHIQDQAEGNKNKKDKIFSNVITWAVIGGLTILINHFLPVLMQVMAAGGK